MTVYYRVDLERGIHTEERPWRFYSKSEELGRTVFKNLFDAKRHFDTIATAEIDRLRALRRRMRKVQSRKALFAALEGDDGGDYERTAGAEA